MPSLTTATGWVGAATHLLRGENHLFVLRFNLFHHCGLVTHWMWEDRDQ